MTVSLHLKESNMNREFERWQNAPPSEKGGIAFDQVARFGIKSLFPTSGDDGLEAGYRKLFREWPLYQVEEFLRWIRALRDAARDQLDLLTLACGDL
jgi:hypothetical protein